MATHWKTDHRCGNQGGEGHRVGCEQWKLKKKFVQKYCGRFLYNNLHNRGIYTINQKTDKLYVDGLFYANKLQGYGQVIYSNGKFFEGLFRENKRFGPGVLTYPDGNQDVGLWNGFALMRLSTLIGAEFTPELGKTSQGQAFLLKYRTLVPIYEKSKDKAKEILHSLGARQEVIDNDSELLYNLNIRNPRSEFFHKNLFDANFFMEEEDCVIEIIENGEHPPAQFKEQTINEPENKDSSTLNSNITEETNASTNYDKSNLDNHCSCFGFNHDYVTQLCIQLDQAEEALEKLLHNKTQIEEELSKRVQPTTKLQPPSIPVINSIQKSETNLFQSETELSTTLYPNNNDQKVNVMDSVDSADQESQAEIRIIDFEDEASMHSCELLKPSRYDDDEQVSNITLPFEMNKEPSTGTESSIKMPQDHAETLSVTGLTPTENPLQMHGSTSALNHKQDDSSKLKKILTEITFYRTIKSNLRWKINRELSYAEEGERDEVSGSVRENGDGGEDEKIKKVRVTDLLAWNNEPIWIDMLQHCFRHRKSQYNVSFNVSDILTGQRQNFRGCGAYEEACRKFLMLCLEGHDRDAFALLKTFGINPDLCDARGNTGLMLASIADRITVIDMLVNYGGKVDGMNDEGLTPLTMALLRYIMFRLEISEWEKAFLREPKLRPEDELGLKEWCPNKYLLRCKATADYASIYNVKESNERSRGGSFHILEQTRKSATDVYFQSSAMMPSANYRTFNEIDEKLARIDVNGNNALPKNFFKNPVQDYVFKTDFVHVPKKKPETKKKNKKSKKDKKNKKKSKDSSSKKSKNSSKKSKKTTSTKRKVSMNSAEMKKRTSEEEEAEARGNLIAKKIEDIKKTIGRLLHVKANPNVGLVPIKPIFITLFTNNSDILSMFLESGADPNTRNEDDATCLHVLASLQPSITDTALEMTQILLDFNASPNLKTNCKHWPEVNREILDVVAVGSQNEEEIGKNPLHLLCLREDFALSDSQVFNGLAKILIENECDTDDLYLGHSPLSLAIFRGNLTLIDTLLATKMINPYRVLGNDMGNALTMLLLRQCLNVWTNQVRLEIIDLLLKHLFNPLAPIGDGFDNAIHFLEREKEKHIIQLAAVKQPKKSKGKQKKKPKAKGKKKKGGKKEAPVKLDEIEKYIVNETRKILVRHLQCQAVRYLYQFVIENIFWDPLIVALAKFLTVNEALNCIKLIFQFGLIELSSFSYVVVADFLEFVALHNDETFDRNSFEIKLQEMSILELKCPKLVYLPLPEIDDNYSVYRVCFQCLQANNRVLKKCPGCELVHFCSEKCNLEVNPYHKCGTNFYNNADETAPANRLKLLMRLAEKSREERIQYFQLKELEMKMFEIKFKPVSLIRKVKQMREVVDEMKKSRENFARKNYLLEYSCGINLLENNSLVNIESKPLSIADQVKINSTLSSFIDGLDNVSSASQKFHLKAPREKSEFLNAEIIQRKIKMIPKLDGHLSKLPLVSDATARFGKVGKNKSPVFVPVADVKKKIDEQAAKIVNKGYYMEMLSKVFADFNLPLILLPYACFKDGQIYYSMSDNVYFRKSFQKLNIPD